MVDEVHGVATSWHVQLFALSKAANFTRGGFKPEFSFFAQFELGILKGCACAWIDDGVGGPKSVGGYGGMLDGLWWRCRGRLWFGKHGTDVIDGVCGNLSAVALFGLLGFETERVVGQGLCFHSSSSLIVWWQLAGLCGVDGVVGRRCWCKLCKFWWVS